MFQTQMTTPQLEPQSISRQRSIFDDSSSSLRSAHKSSPSGLGIRRRRAIDRLRMVINVEFSPELSRRIHIKNETLHNDSNKGALPPFHLNSQSSPHQSRPVPNASPKRLRLPMMPWNDIQELKQKIFDLTGLAMKEQRLFFRGKEITKNLVEKRRASLTQKKADIYKTQNNPPKPVHSVVSNVSAVSTIDDEPQSMSATDLRSTNSPPPALNLDFPMMRPVRAASSPEMAPIHPLPRRKSSHSISPQHGHAPHPPVGPPPPLTIVTTRASQISQSGATPKSMAGRPPPLNVEPVPGEAPVVEEKKKKTNIKARFPTLSQYGITDNSTIYIQTDRADETLPVVPFSKISRYEDCRQMVEKCVEGLIEYQRATRAGDGTGGTYFMKSADGKKMACFKPEDEEAGCSNNPHGRTTAPMRAGIAPGTGNLREVAAFLLDKTGFHDVPKTTRVEMSCDQLCFEGTGRDDTLDSAPPKVGSLQQFIDSTEMAGDFHHDRFRKRDVHKIGILDMRMLNCDRNDGNVMVVKDERSVLELIPIDHGLSIPAKIEITNDDWIWLGWKQSKEPFDPFTDKFIANIDVEADIDMLRAELGLSEIALENMRISAMVLKKGAEIGLTLFQIGSIIARPDFEKPSILEDLCETAEILAYEKLRQMHHLALRKRFAERMRPKGYTPSQTQQTPSHRPYPQQMIQKPLSATITAPHSVQLNPVMPATYAAPSTAHYQPSYSQTPIYSGLTMPTSTAINRSTDIFGGSGVIVPVLKVSPTRRLTPQHVSPVKTALGRSLSPSLESANYKPIRPQLSNISSSGSTGNTPLNSAASRNENGNELARRGMVSRPSVEMFSRLKASTPNADQLSNFSTHRTYVYHDTDEDTPVTSSERVLADYAPETGWARAAAEFQTVNTQHTNNIMDYLSVSSSSGAHPLMQRQMPQPFKSPNFSIPLPKTTAAILNQKLTHVNTQTTNNTTANHTAQWNVCAPVPVTITPNIAQPQSQMRNLPALESSPPRDSSNSQRKSIPNGGAPYRPQSRAGKSILLNTSDDSGTDDNFDAPIHISPQIDESSSDSSDGVFVFGMPKLMLSADGTLEPRVEIDPFKDNSNSLDKVPDSPPPLRVRTSSVNSYQADMENDSETEDSSPTFPKQSILDRNSPKKAASIEATPVSASATAAAAAAAVATSKTHNSTPTHTVPTHANLNVVTQYSSEDESDCFAMPMGSRRSRRIDIPIAHRSTVSIKSAIEPMSGGKLESLQLTGMGELCRSTSLMNLRPNPRSSRHSSRIRPSVLGSIMDENTPFRIQSRSKDDSFAGSGIYLHDSAPSHRGGSVHIPRYNNVEPPSYTKSGRQNYALNSVANAKTTGLDRNTATSRSASSLRLSPRISPTLGAHRIAGSGHRGTPPMRAVRARQNIHNNGMSNLKLHHDTSNPIETSYSYENSSSPPATFEPPKMTLSNLPLGGDPLQGSAYMSSEHEMSSSLQQDYLSISGDIDHQQQLQQQLYSQQILENDRLSSEDATLNSNLTGDGSHSPYNRPDYAINSLLERMTSEKTDAQLRTYFMYYLGELVALHCKRIAEAAKKEDCEATTDQIYDVDTPDGVFVWKNELRKLLERRRWRSSRLQEREDRGKVNPFEHLAIDSSSEVGMKWFEAESVVDDDGA